MREQLNALIVSNSDDDIKLILRELKKSGYEITWKKATSKDDAISLLNNEKWDVILLEYMNNKDFTALDILDVKNKLAIQTPFILIYEDINNDKIIELMKNGCSNCIIKENLSQLGSVVSNEIFNCKFEYEKLAEAERIKRHYDNLLFNARRYKLAINGSNDGIWDWDIIKDKGYISYKLKEILGMSSEDMEQFLDTWWSLIHPEDREAFEEALENYIYQKTPYFVCEYRVKSKDNDYIWFLTRGKAIRDKDGAPIRMAGSHTDITDRKKAEEKINYLAYYDIVTGLANRTLFEEKLNKTIEKAKEKKEMFGIVYLDLDNFKTVNDTMGHDFGNLLLKDIGDLLKRHIGKQDMAARLSGDEFVILVPRLNSNEKLKNMINGINNEFREPFILGNQQVYVTMSSGIVIYPIDGEDEQTILKNADTAMYCAKEIGKNNYQFFMPEMNEKIVEKLKLQNDLRNAVKNQEFVVNYQPQISIETGKIVGLEALVRWIHPVEGIVSPLKFIPAAEETGLIEQIGEFVLRSACKQNKLWQEKGYAPMCIAVNLSARQFQQKKLIKIIENVLDETALDPEWLELEITESISMKDLDFTINTLHNFKDIGIKVALDDFGTGYSSLNYLKKLPIHSLKMDKSFVDDITNDSKELAIAKAITTLAKTMNLSIVAEGVETKEQLLLLKELEVDIAQGYLISKPLPAEEIEKCFQE